MDTKKFPHHLPTKKLTKLIPHVTIHDVPFDVLKLVFGYMTPVDCLATLRVNKRWGRLAKERLITLETTEDIVVGEATWVKNSVVHRMTIKVCTSCKEVGVRCRRSCNMCKTAMCKTRLWDYSWTRTAPSSGVKFVKTRQVCCKCLVQIARKGRKMNGCDMCGGFYDRKPCHYRVV